MSPQRAESFRVIRCYCVSCYDPYYKLEVLHCCSPRFSESVFRVVREFPGRAPYIVTDVQEILYVFPKFYVPSVRLILSRLWCLPAFGVMPFMLYRVPSVVASLRGWSLPHCSRCVSLQSLLSQWAILHECNTNHMKQILVM